jgi:D-glycero-alpha-D-manno-heptose-7-phosphate kinase
MYYRSRAPLRLGLAGGGTDVSPYSETFGGAVLNATISMFANATLTPREDGKVVFHAVDKGERLEYEAADRLEFDGKLDLMKGVYNRVVKDFALKPLSLELTTHVDAPPGSGLGSSSTLVVTMLGAFSEWLGLPLGEYEMAHLAFEIERKDLAMAGGKQDQYAATFGGFNFIEFYGDDRVIVNPLRVKEDYVNELESNFVLYYTGTSRLSSTIVEMQSSRVQKKEGRSVEAMHNLKKQASMMKEAILKGRFEDLGKILAYGWQFKKDTAEGISNPVIDRIYEAALAAGSSGGKISGAGGGGFMIFFCPNTSRYRVIDTLHSFGGEFRRFQFTNHGLTTWSAR